MSECLRNIGEYYSAHYLAHQLTKDIAEPVKAWKKEGSGAPPKRVSALADAFFRAKSDALDVTAPELRSQSDLPAVRAWHGQWLAALGYVPEPCLIELEGEQAYLPALIRLNRHGKPWLAICQTHFCLSEGEGTEEPLEQAVHFDSGLDLGDAKPFNGTWEQAVTALFKEEERPRWVMLLAGALVYLLDAETFAQGRYLCVDLDATYGLKEAATFEQIAALYARAQLAPDADSDQVLLEKLRDGSSKSAHGVSERLQDSVREAIQCIANGWVKARVDKKLGYRQLGDKESPLPDGSRKVTAEQLRRESLVYVYRILFCLYAEARGKELGILPISDEIYRLGYSIEALRDLADLGEPGTQSEAGSYYADHLARLFGLIHAGFHPDDTAAFAPPKAEEKAGFLTSPPQQSELFYAASGIGVPQQSEMFGAERGKAKTTAGKAWGHFDTKAFVISPLTANLFDPTATPLLNRVKLSNRTLHTVIRCLSVGRSANNKQLGRINYAELGIVQLGSVYEGLLSYKGFFAEEDLIQVLAKAKNGKPVLDNAIDHKTPTWFVPATRKEDFEKGEIVLEHRTQDARIYKTGEFILHLNGVDREQSASYYTPEVLTRTLVREALKERLKDIGPDQADEILALKICEPAMGSAAFLVEAIDQLAHAYLQRKQEQLDRNIDPGDYESELRRTRHYIAVHNVYGVDLNATAVELGALSLWLASIHRLRVSEGSDGAPDRYRPGATPWFGLRLRAGNSLIGARRAVWTRRQLEEGKHLAGDAEAPRQLKPGASRGKDEIYHFLVWDEDMTPAARDALMREHWPSECAAVAGWRNQQVRTPWTPQQVSEALRICEQIDVLWTAYAAERAKALRRTACTATVWPLEQDDVRATAPSMGLHQQEQVRRTLESQSGAFQRLRLLMDTWCGFYFWPLEQHKALPSREGWLAAARILVGAEVSDAATRALLNVRVGNEVDLEALFRASQQNLPDAEAIAAAVPWFGVGHEIAANQPFHHWELVFTEILGPDIEDAKITPRGFDLMFGNPPWLKVSWSDAALLSEYDPKLGVKQAKSADFNTARPDLLETEARQLDYRTRFAEGEGSAVFLNDRTLYPALAGVQTNLYKNFIERSWDLLSSKGYAGLLHPEGVFDDPKGALFRERYYQRLTKHFQFKNECMLFHEIGNRVAFSVNCYRGRADRVRIESIFNLFRPETISRSIETIDAGQAQIPAIKDEAGNWEFRGHPQRIINITEKELGLFARLFEDDDTPPLQARLPQVHSQPLMQVLEKFAATPRRLGDLRGQYMATVMFDETHAQRDGIITRQDDPSFQPATADEWVVSGPHFYVGCPFNKTPHTSVRSQRSYDDIDLTDLSEDYLPRGVYRPGDKHGDLSKFYDAIPEWPKPSRPGFWPVSDAEVSAYEALLGEPLKRYCIDSSLPGAKTARQFGYFTEWEGDAERALSLLQIKAHRALSAEEEAIVAAATIVQQAPTEDELLRLPKPLSSRTRLFFRRRGQPANERTLIPSLMPAGVTHIHPVLSFSFADSLNAALVSACSISLLWDFLVRVAGKSDIYDSTLRQFPLPSSQVSNYLGRRLLRLVCITRHFSSFYNEAVPQEGDEDSWSISRNGTVELDQIETPWSEISAIWDIRYALRSDWARYLALVEIDTLLALNWGLAVDELIQIYEVQFAALCQYERVDQYDVKGRRLPNTARKDPGAKELRDALKDHDDHSPVTVSWDIDNGNQTVTRTFYPPFNNVDRVEDYRTAYRVFKERFDSWTK